MAPLNLVSARARLLKASTLADLPVDESTRVASHLLLLRDDSLANDGKALSYQIAHPDLQAVVVSGELAEALLPVEGRTGPVVGCVERGMSRGLISRTAIARATEEEVPSESALDAWVHQRCEFVEVGFINYLSTEVELMWVAPNGRLHDQAVLPPNCKISILGSECVHWRNSLVGHRFQMRPNLLDAAPVTITALFSGVHSICTPTELPYSATHKNWTRVVEHTSARERTRVMQVHKTFTEAGFDRAPIPEREWASMSTYYYNNRHAAQREDWDQLADSAFVNWCAGGAALRHTRVLSRYVWMCVFPAPRASHAQRVH